MDFYVSNGLCEYIKENRIDNYKFVNGNYWQLVYGDRSCTPKLLVLAVAETLANLKNQTYKEQKIRMDMESEAWLILRQLSNLTGLPLRYILFPGDIEKLTHVVTFKEAEMYKTVSVSELTRLFGEERLPVNPNPDQEYETEKPKNKRISSNFHDWQRKYLGAGLKATDIDLLKIDVDGKIDTIYELKRSYKSFEEWAPVRKDFNNFRMLYRIAVSCGLGLKLIYNVFDNEVDDISKFKLYDLDFSSTPPYIYLGERTLTNLLD